MFLVVPAAFAAVGRFSWTYVWTSVTNVSTGNVYRRF